MQNWRAALVAAMVANTVRDTKKRRKPFMPADFMPTQQEEDTGPADWEELAAKAKAIFAGLKGSKEPLQRRVERPTHRKATV